MAYYRSRPGDEAVGHGLLGLLMAALGVSLGLVIALSFGVQLPDPRQVAHSLGLERSLGFDSEPGPPGGARAVGGPLPGETEDEAAGASCEPEQPAFTPRFAELRERLGAEMGDALECEQTNPENGDVLQLTTAGLAYYRNATGTPSFTDGWKHWALTPDGLLYWEGDSADPPPEAERLGR